MPGPKQKRNKVKQRAGQRQGVTKWIKIETIRGVVKTGKSRAT